MSVPHDTDVSQILAILIRIAVLTAGVAGIVGAFRKKSIYKAIMSAYRRGDYEGALQATEKFRKNGQETRTYCFYRGAFANELGDTAQAETYLQRAVLLSDVEKGVDDRLKSLAHDALGESLMDANRYDEALREFAMALRYWPTHGGTHRNMAEAWLRRGMHSEEALKLARVATDEERTISPLSSEVHRINLSEAVSTLAWAIAAENRDRTQVDANVTEALKLAGNTSVPTFARVRFYAGNAYAALGDRERSLHLFDEAAQRDTRGRWGRAARAKASEL